MDIEENIKDLVESVLGKPKRDFASSGSWYEFDCPNCAEENCGVHDGKHNLAVNVSVSETYYHCWRCEIAGRLSNLFKKYGSPDTYRKYKDLINDYKTSHLYEIQSGEVNISDDPDKQDELEMPKNVESVYDGTETGNMALRYLYDRGLDDFLIKKHNLKYVGNVYGNEYKNMIIVPSYDVFGNLNYYSGRDFTGKTDFNKRNPHVKKTEVVFNEGLINWYEPITLVEGPFDHIVTPNSIPLLGKPIDETYLVYKVLKERSKNTINIMLDDDAYDRALLDYKIMNNGVFYDRIRIIRCPEGYDPSDVYKDFGRRGILNLLASAKKVDDYTLSKIKMRRS